MAATVALFKIDEYGYPRFTNSGFMPRKEAEKMLREDPDFAGCRAMTYGEYKRDMDPDDMSEAERARRFGGKVSTPAKRVAVTGKIEGYTRTDIKDRLKKMGYAVTERVDETVSALICGEGSGSKLRKAESLDIPVYASPEALA